MTRAKPTTFRFAARPDDSAIIAVDVDLADIEFAKGAALMARYPDLPVLQTALGSENKLPNVAVRKTPNPFTDSGIAQAVSAFETSRLIIIGDDMHGGVSSAALAALELGYDVYLVDDATVFHGKEVRSLFKHRFRANGGIVVSAKHLTNELDEIQPPSR